MNAKQLYNKYLPYFKPYRTKYLIASALLGLSYVLLFSSIGYMLSNVFSLVTEYSTSVAYKSIIYLLIIVLCSFFSAFIMIYFTKVEKQIQCSIREDILHSYLQSNESDVQPYSAEEVMNRISIDLPKVTQLFGWNMVGYVYEPFFGAVFCILYLFTLHWLAAFICILCALLGFLATRLFSKKKAEAIGKTIEFKSETLNYLSQTLYGCEEIRIFSLQRIFESKIKDYIQPVQKNIHKAGIYTSIRAFCISFCSDCLGYISILLLGAYLSYKGYLPFSKILICISMIDLIWQGFTSIGSYKNFLEEAKIPEKRVLEILELPKQEHTLLDNEEDTISLKNVSFSYNKDKEILKNISITIPLHKKIAFIGESGSGKTTCAKCIAGIYSCSSGSISIPKKEKITYMSQDSSLLKAPIQENISLSKLIDKEKLETVLLESSANTFLTEKEYSFIPTSDTGEYSGGQIQRISLARALYSDPTILILDEPTASLDQENADSIQSQIFSIKDKTILIISHRMDFVKNCDYIYYFENGKIIEAGNPKELLQTNSKYKQAYEMQKKQI